MDKPESRDGGSILARVIRADPNVADVPIALFTGFDMEDEWRSLFDAYILKGEHNNHELMAIIQTLLMELG